MSMFRHSPQADMSTLASRAAQNALPRRGSMVAKLEAKAALTALPKRTPLPTIPFPTERVAPVLTVLPPVNPAPVKETWGDTASKIVVIGAGGAGCNAVGRMVDQPTANLKDIRFAVANTDAQALKDNVCELKVTLGPKVTRGLGAGGNAAIGTKAAEESVKAIETLIGDADLVFLTLGLGGGTGSGAAPIIARVAHEKGAVVVAIATLPFAFEGAKRAYAANEALEHLRAHADTVVVVNNNALLSLFEKDRKKMTLPFAFSIADQCLQQAVDGMVGIIHHSGYINLDFADVRATLQKGGHGYFGMGLAEGEHAASKAMDKAMNSHLLGESGVVGAKKVLVYFKGDPGMGDIHAAMERLNTKLAPDTSTIFGWGLDSELGDQVEVTLFAVGVDLNPPTLAPATAITPPAPSVAPAIAVKAEKPERVDAAIAILPVTKTEPVAPIRSTYNPKGAEVPTPASVDAMPAATPRQPVRASAPAESKMRVPGRSVVLSDGDDNVPSFLLRKRGEKGSTPSFDLTTDQTDHSYQDELDVPAFLRRRGSR
jgi:cell division protein FtsZ